MAMGVSKAAEIARTGNIPGELARPTQHIDRRVEPVALAQPDCGPAKGPDKIAAHFA